MDSAINMKKKTIYIESQDRKRCVSLAVELATTEDTWEKGLKFRYWLRINEGMFFIFQEPQLHGFWMKDTCIPLTVAYIDKGGQIIELQDLEPLDETSKIANQPYRYALEVNQGWFESHGLGVGSYIVIGD